MSDTKIPKIGIDITDSESVDVSGGTISNMDIGIRISGVRGANISNMHISRGDVGILIGDSAATQVPTLDDLLFKIREQVPSLSNTQKNELFTAFNKLQREGNSRSYKEFLDTTEKVFSTVNSITSLAQLLWALFVRSNN